MPSSRTFLEQTTSMIVQWSWLKVRRLDSPTRPQCHRVLLDKSTSGHFKDSNMFKSLSIKTRSNWSLYTDSIGMVSYQIFKSISKMCFYHWWPLLELIPQLPQRYSSKFSKRSTNLKRTRRSGPNWEKDWRTSWRLLRSTITLLSTVLIESP